MLRSRPVTLLAGAAVGALFVVGLLLDGVPGGLLVLAVGAVLAVLTVSAWEHVPERRRPARLVVLAAVLAIGVIKVVQA